MKPVDEFILTRLQSLRSDQHDEVISLDLRLSDSGLDSLEMMELLSDLEDSYRIRIDDSVLSQETTVQSLISFIQHQLIAQEQSRQGNI